MNLFKTVKESVTVKQAAALYGLPVTSTWMIHCPFHEDHTPSMKLNDTYYYCFGCGATGDVIDLTAQWTANAYTIRFDGNGGEGDMSELHLTYDDDPTALTSNAFTRTGYTYTGWNTAADGTGTAYADAQEVHNLSATPGVVITLYAQWQAHTYTVRFDGNGGEGDYYEDETEDMYQAEIGMSVGPSVTINPIDHLKANLYFRVTPSFSMLYAAEEFSTSYGTFFSFGGAISYRVISLGIEGRWGNVKYDSMFDLGALEDIEDTGDIDLSGDKPSTKWKVGSMRFYVSLRF